MIYDRFDYRQMTLPDIVRLYAIQGIETQELPNVSEYLIDLGMESPFLVDLLVSQDSASEQKKIFENAIRDLGLDLPSQSNAAIALAKKIAEQIQSGERTPYDGAIFIWKNILDRLDEIPDQLWPFKSNASAIEDVLSHMDNYKNSDNVSGFDGLIESCTTEILDSVKVLCQL